MSLKDPFETEVELLLQALLMQYHYDFTHYSRSSIHRRVRAALQQFRARDVAELQSRVLREPAFLPDLIDYLTVPTTEMFRDPAFFRSLRDSVIPYLRTYPSIKAWVAGCSTGEEVWSLAILLREEGLLDKALIYATDINHRRLEKAKRGIFEREAVQKASANYVQSGGKASLSDHYDAAYGNVRFDPSLAKGVVFTDHSLATDSAFAEVQLVTCRNVLIYFDRPLQDRAIGLFRDSLARDGFLGIGTKESLEFSAHRESFEPLVRSERIYRRRG